jgi:hypothetical protein
MLRRNVLRMLKLLRGKNSRPSTMFLIGICMPMNAAVRSALLARHRDCPKEADRDPDWPRQLLKSAQDHGLIVVSALRSQRISLPIE